MINDCRSGLIRINCRDRQDQTMKTKTKATKMKTTENNTDDKTSLGNIEE